jgi:hypothetical protein
MSHTPEGFEVGLADPRQVRAFRTAAKVAIVAHRAAPKPSPKAGSPGGPTRKQKDFIQVS